MKIRSYGLRRDGVDRGKCCGARRRQDHFKSAIQTQQDHDQFRHRDAGRRLSALRQCLCRGHECSRSDACRSSRATPRAATRTFRCWKRASSISRLSRASLPMRPSGHRPAATHLKILTAMYSSPGMFVVRADSPYKTIRDLVGQPIAFGAKGSGLPILSRYMLDGIGLKQDEDFKSVYLDHAGDGPAMVLDGRVAALWGAGIGWPGFTAIATSPGGARFIAPDADEIARIRAKHIFLKPLTVRGRQLSEPERGDQFGRLLEFHPGPRQPAGRCRLSAGEDAARRRRRRSARSSRRPAKPPPPTPSPPRPKSGSDPSRRAEISSARSALAK